MPGFHRRPLTVFALGAALAVGGTAAVNATAKGGGGKSGPATIPLPTDWQPEGIASGPGNSLFVGSIPTGQVLRVDPRTGKQKVVVGPREGRQATGLKYGGGKLYVSGSRTGHAYVYDARTGEDVADVTLSEQPSFVNDVTLTRDAAWFTDSLNPRLYRLDRRTNQATAVPITGALQYDADPATLESNGIAAADGGRSLLVVQTRTGGLFKVDPKTGASTQVALTGGAENGKLTNGDGLLLKGRTLYVVQNRLNKIAAIKLNRDLTAGTITQEITNPAFEVPTTIAKARGSLYAVNAQFGTPAPTDYAVVRVGEKSKGKGHDHHGDKSDDRSRGDDDDRGRGRGSDDD